MHTFANTERLSENSLVTLQTIPGPLAMQYSYTLPADYDMSIIRRRISDKGHLMNGFPNLLIKAFAYAARTYNIDYTRSNLYAPFYIWKNHDGLHRFLESPGFVALTQSFGWPAITTWSVLVARFRETFNIASWATRERIEIPSYTGLDQLQLREKSHISDAMASKSLLGGFAAFEPTGWTLVRYKLWTTCPYHLIDSRVQIYQVGFMAANMQPVDAESTS